MDDEIKELFKREVDRYEYLYAKANTKSKKKEIAYDLIFFEMMYNNLVDEKVVFSWSNDIDLIRIRLLEINKFINNVLKEQDLCREIFENSFNIFIEEEYSLYTDYYKGYHKLSEELLQKYIGMFLRSIDISLVDRFKNKLENLELFMNNDLGEHKLGLTFPLEAINKNIIMFSAYGYYTVESASALVHELGHDFEFDYTRRAGMTGFCGKILESLYAEVCPHFFEYAFINYLIENKIYLEDALMLRRRYLNQIVYYLSEVLSIMNIDSLKIDYKYNTLLETDDVVDYANELIMKINSCAELYNVGDKISFRSAFVYSMGRLMSICLYEIYKENPKEFLSNFRKVLIDYKNNGFESFSKIGITKELMSNGEVLRRVLKDTKRNI